MSQVELILVGGFLGAGKTTLLAKAAEALIRRGRRVGIITNDQAAELVDTALLRGGGLEVREVSGGCFCCRFDDLVRSARKLIEKMQPDVLLGEPVGSCADIVSTVVRPIGAYHADMMRMGRFSVLADPRRMREALGLLPRRSFPESVLYVFRKQVEEADIIVLNKMDLLSPAEAEELKAAVADKLPGREILTMSAARAEGVEAWLSRAEAPASGDGRHVAVDYDVYAAGEAELGWLNATAEVTPKGGTDWQAFALRLMREIAGRLARRSAEVAHLKLFLGDNGRGIVANLTAGASEPTARGTLGDVERATLTVNARVAVDPESLEQVVREGIAAAAGTQIAVEVRHVAAFRPGRPTPTHRMT